MQVRLDGHRNPEYDMYNKLQRMCKPNMRQRAVRQMNGLRNILRKAKAREKELIVIVNGVSVEEQRAAKQNRSDIAKERYRLQREFNARNYHSHLELQKLYLEWCEAGEDFQPFRDGEVPSCYILAV